MHAPKKLHVPRPQDPCGWNAGQHGAPLMPQRIPPLCGKQVGPDAPTEKQAKFAGSSQGTESWQHAWPSWPQRWQTPDTHRLRNGQLPQGTFVQPSKIVPQFFPCAAQLVVG